MVKFSCPWKVSHSARIGWMSASIWANHIIRLFSFALLPKHVNESQFCDFAQLWGCCLLGSLFGLLCNTWSVHDGLFRHSRCTLITIVCHCPSVDPLTMPHSIPLISLCMQIHQPTISLISSPFFLSLIRSERTLPASYTSLSWADCSPRIWLVQSIRLIG